MKLSPRRRAAALAALLGACTAHCDGSGAARGSSRGGEDGAPAQATDGGRAADGGPVLRPPRRPSRRYILAYGKERCIVYWEDGDQRSQPNEVRCPRELQSGERIRLAGRVCLREGSGSTRGVPVRCPTDLVARELADRQDAGL